MAGEKFQPNNSLANIHGMVDGSGNTTCVTKKGKMCTGCCTALLITEKGSNTVLKADGDDCNAQEKGRGCIHVLNGEPEKRFPVCPLYHCSRDIRILDNPLSVRPERIAASQRLTMANSAALLNNEIEKSDFNLNLKRIPTP